MLNTLEAAPGSTKDRKRVGRGPGSTLGKTCGRGHKGQNSRSGSKRRIGFEGGQMPLHRRVPKRGFKNIFSKNYNVINLDDIIKSKKLDSKAVVTPATLAQAGLIRDNNLPLKVLGEGELENPLTIEAHRFSVSAEKKILGTGGTVKLLESV